MTSSEDRRLILSIYEEAVLNGARKKAFCEYFEIPHRTIQRWANSSEDQRSHAIKNPKNKLSDKEREQIISTCCNEQFRDLTPHEIVPILAEEGTYIASESTFYRVLRQEEMLSHRALSKPPKARAKTEPLKATGPNQVWSWDITYLKTEVKGMFYFLYLFMDIWSRKVVAWDIFDEQNAENAGLIMSDMQSSIDTKGIRLHSDNGSPMKGATFLGTLHKLGIVPSYSRPACSNDNAYSESLFKTLKYSQRYPSKFRSISHAKEWTAGFVDWYNNEHRHSMIQYCTPNQRHQGDDLRILEARKETYREAMSRHPERFIQKTVRQWKHIGTVELNPEKEDLKVAS